MNQEATARVLQLVPQNPARIPFLEPEKEAEFRHRIYQAELAYMNTVESRRAEGKLVFDGRLARMLTPLALTTSSESARNRHLGPGESVLLWEGDQRSKYQLVRGDTSYFKWRGQWDVFNPIRDELRQDTSLTKQQRWDALYDLFAVVHGVMACCRMDFDGVSHILCVVRGAKIDMKNVGQISFPAGSVQAFDTVPEAMERVLQYEGLVDVATSYNGLVKYNFPDCPSMTLGGLFEARWVKDKTLPRDTLAKLGAMDYVWVEQDVVSACIAGDSDRMKQRFEDQGITIPVQEDGSRVVKMAADAALTFSTFQSLGLL